MLFEIIHKSLYCTIHSFFIMWWTHVHLWGHWYPVLDFWWCLLSVSKPEWVALFALGGGVHDVCSLRFTSGVTPADLLVASMAAKSFSSTYLWTSIGGTWDQDLSHCYLTVWVQANAPTNWAMPVRHAQYTLLSRSLETIFNSSIFQPQLELNHVDAFGDQLKPGPIYAVTFIPGAPLTVY